MKEVSDNFRKIAVLLLSVAALIPFLSYGRENSYREYSVAYSNRDSDFDLGDIRVEAKLSADRLYEGQSVALSVVLYTDNPDIAYVSLISDEKFDGFTPVNAPSIDNGEGRLRISNRDKKRSGHDEKPSYSALAYRAILIPRKTGTVTIPKLDFVVGVRVPSTIEHPFFGLMRSTKVVEETISTHSMRIKCNSLPKSPADFTGSVGDFSIDAILPPGKIEAGSQGIVVFRISGTGIIDENRLPDFRAFFPEGLTFNSAGKDASKIISGTDVESTVEIECTFTPSAAGEFILPPVSFTYFDPSTRSYLTSRSKSLKIKVSGDGERVSPPALHSI